ncbi:potassium channel family protein [Vibrio gigantis]
MKKLKAKINAHPIVTVLLLLFAFVLGSSVYLSSSDIKFKIPNETVTMTMTYNDKGEMVNLKTSPEELDKKRPLKFGEALYFSLVTFSSVGYGDIVPISPNGRNFCMWFILISQFFIYVGLPLTVGRVVAIELKPKT